MMTPNPVRPPPVICAEIRLGETKLAAPVAEDATAIEKPTPEARIADERPREAFGVRSDPTPLLMNALLKRAVRARSD
jgi:hypothetical protein